MILILDFPRRNSQKCTQGAGWDFGDGGPKLQGVPGGLPQDSALLGRHHSKLTKSSCLRQDDVTAALASRSHDEPEGFQGGRPDAKREFQSRPQAHRQVARRRRRGGPHRRRRGPDRAHRSERGSCGAAVHGAARAGRPVVRRRDRAGEARGGVRQGEGPERGQPRRRPRRPGALDPRPAQGSPDGALLPRRPAGPEPAAEAVRPVHGLRFLHLGRRLRGDEQPRHRELVRGRGHPG